MRNIPNLSLILSGSTVFRGALILLFFLCSLGPLNADGGHYIGANVSGGRFRLGPTYALDEAINERVLSGASSQTEDIDLRFARFAVARQPGITTDFAQAGISYLDLFKNFSYRGSVGRSNAFTASRSEFIQFESLEAKARNINGQNISPLDYRDSTRLEQTRYRSTVFRTDHDASVWKPLNEKGSLFFELGFRFQAYRYTGSPTPGLGIVNIPSNSSRQDFLQVWRYPITSFSLQHTAMSPAYGIGMAFSFLDQFSLTTSVSLLVPVGQIYYSQEYLALTEVREGDTEDFNSVKKQNSTREVYIYDAVEVRQTYIGLGGTADVHLNWTLGSVVLRLSGRYQVFGFDDVNVREINYTLYNSYYNDTPEEPGTQAALINLWYDTSVNERCGFIFCDAIDFGGSSDELGQVVFEVLINAF